MERKMIEYVITERGTRYDVTLRNCYSITEHSARGEGDKWFYDVQITKSRTIRIFDPVEVGFVDLSNDSRLEIARVSEGHRDVEIHALDDREEQE
jgi:hypothetical protein